MSTSNGMVEVRIRHAQHDEAVYLCAVPIHEVDAVIPHLQEWSVFARDFGDSFGTGDMAGQFVLPMSGPAYFEVIVGEP